MASEVLDFSSMKMDRVTTLKRNLEGWREALVPLNSLLKWDRPYDPVVLLSINTFIFIVLWYFEPSVLTTFSLLGIIACVIDYLVPTLSATCFDPSNWTAAKEKKYDALCTELVEVQDNFTAFLTHMNELKQTKPKVYFFVVLLLLCTSAWIGNLVDNFLLTFLMLSILILLPGLQQHRIFKKYFSRLVLATSSALGGVKAKQN